MINLTPAESELVAHVLEIIKKDKSEDKIVDEIMKTAQTSWESQLSPDDIGKWLENFSGEALGSSEVEQHLALWLLSGFIYFSLDDIREYCQYIFSEFIHKKLLEYKDAQVFQELSINEQIQHILNSTVFLALGNDSESGSNILYYFRQENRLDKEIFEKKLDQKYENLVFVDDVTISGNQALEYIGKLSKSIDADNIYFLTFLASDTAISDLSPLKVHVIYGNQLTNRERCFDEESYVFASLNKRPFLPIAAKMCEYYGSKIVAGHSEADGYPLGYDEAQSMFCFFYNTPDNTLPIFWCDGAGWNPIFKRYKKIITRTEVLINDSRYV